MCRHTETSEPSRRGKLKSLSSEEIRVREYSAPFPVNNESALSKLLPIREGCRFTVVTDTPSPSRAETIWLGVPDQTRGSLGFPILTTARAGVILESPIS